MRSPENKKAKRLIFFMVLSLVVIIGVRNSLGQISTAKSRIVRITHSKAAVVKYPSISNNGQKLLYLSESRDLVDPDKILRSIKIINVNGTEEKVLFIDKAKKAPPPYPESYLVCGTRPPLLSGDGSRAFFALSIEEPLQLNDHYLGVINTDGTVFKVFALRNGALASLDWQKKGFKDDTWNRISNYAVSNDGKKLVLIVKGHHGPRKFGFPSGILVMGSDGRDQRALLSPAFEEEGWVWPSYPRRPYTEGGWAFAFSGNGEKILFGAQSSATKDDYDLYLVNWDGSKLRKITDFKDRFFTIADISDDGKRIVFFYGGKNRQGIGTYSIYADGTGLKYLRSKVADRVDFEDMDSKGKRILHRYKYFGILMDLYTQKEVVILHPEMMGYAGSNGTFMDFPYFLSFWNPRFMAEDKVIITGTPKGRIWREFYLLDFTLSDIK
jgi:hypothetical protein